MTDTRDVLTGYERSNDMLLAISGGLQLSGCTARKRNNKQLLTSELYFQCLEVDAAADAVMTAVLLVNVS